MEKLQTITHPQFGPLSVIIINDKEMFKAREIAKMLGYKNINDAIARHCKGVVKYDLPTASGKQEYNLIPEGDVWRLIIRSKLPQAESIEKWIMDEVLPSIRKNGTYTIQNHNKQSSTYTYFEKKLNSEPVLSSMDVSHFTGIHHSVVDWYARTHLINGIDYYSLKGDELRKFKSENPQVSKLSSTVVVFNKSGFDSVCRFYNISIETPKLFIDVKPAKEYAVVIGNQHIKNMIDSIRRHMTAVDVLLDKYYRHNIEINDMKALRKTIGDVGMELGLEISALSYEKVGTTTKHKY